MDNTNCENNIKTIYWLDNHDRIIEVSPSWDDFAKKNNGEAVLSDNIIGRPIKGFIKSDETRMFIETIFSKARLLSKPIEREYRCDSPDTKRYMKMVVIPEEYNVLRVEHHIIRIENTLITLNFQYARDMLSRFLKRCSICNKIHFKSKWIEGDSWEIVSYIKKNSPINVIYTVCEICRVNVGKIAV